MMDFESKLEHFYSKLDLENTSVVDVGANLGRHTIPLAKKVGEAGVLFAFEPIPVIRNHLNENIASNMLNNVVVYPFALSTKRGISEFNYIPNLPEESGLKKRHRYNAVPSEFRIIKVGVFRLDDLIPSASQVSFIKIDVEGGELDVLLGAVVLLKTSRPIVAFECGAGSFLGYHETPEVIFDMFSSLQYLVFSITGELIKDATAFHDASYAQNFWDYIALPIEKKELARYLTS
jgi:FkbM family methyltransferase